MILKLKFDNKPNIGDGLAHDEFSPIIVCTENKDFPMCEFAFLGEQKFIDVKLFRPGVSYNKKFNILFEQSSEFLSESKIEYTIQK